MNPVGAPYARRGEDGGGELCALSFYLGNARLDTLVPMTVALIEVIAPVMATLRQVPGRKPLAAEDEVALDWHCRRLDGTEVDLRASCQGNGIGSGTILTLIPTSAIGERAIDDPACALAGAPAGAPAGVPAGAGVAGSGDARERDGGRMLAIWAITGALGAVLAAVSMVRTGPGPGDAGGPAEVGARWTVALALVAGVVAGVMSALRIRGKCHRVIRLGQWTGSLTGLCAGAAVVGHRIFGGEAGRVAALSVGAIIVLVLCSNRWIGYLCERAIGPDPPPGGKSIWDGIAQDLRDEIVVAYLAGAVVLIGCAPLSARSTPGAALWAVVAACWALHARRVIDRRAYWILGLTGLVALCAVVATACVYAGAHDMSGTIRYAAGAAGAIAICAVAGMYVRARHRLRWQYFLQIAHHLAYLAVIPAWAVMVIG